MITPPALIAKVMEQHGLNILAAWDVNERLRLYYNEGVASSLTEDLNDLVKAFDGVFMVKAWKRSPEKGGRPKESVQMYSWHVRGNGKKSVGEAEGIGAMHGVPDAVVNELAQLRAERMVRERMEAEADNSPEDEKDASMGKLVDLLTTVLAPKMAAPSPSQPVAGAERGHPSALTKERMMRILNAVKNCHAMDPAAFDQYEAMLVAQYGSTKKAG